MQKANVVAYGSEGKRIQVTVIKEVVGPGKVKMTYNSPGWGHPMGQGEFSTMCARQGLTVYPNRPRFSNVKEV